MLSKAFTITALVLAITISSKSEDVDLKQEECAKILSCSSCLEKSFCTWCVTKSKCTEQSCGNDNIIFPEKIPALMSGPRFCPRVVAPENMLTIKSGAKEVIVVKLTQIHLYMAFTPWKCQVMLEGMPKAKTVVAVLVGDSVYCESMEFANDSKNPYITGSVSVLWDFSKTFDGTVPLKVCSCDLDPTCSACKI